MVQTLCVGADGRYGGVNHLPAAGVGVCAFHVSERFYGCRSVCLPSLIGASAGPRMGGATKRILLGRMGNQLSGPRAARMAQYGPPAGMAEYDNIIRMPYG